MFRVRYRQRRAEDVKDVKMCRVMIQIQRQEINKQEIEDV
jgi:hypothetical protein